MADKLNATKSRLTSILAETDMPDENKLSLAYPTIRGLKAIIETLDPRNREDLDHAPALEHAIAVIIKWARLPTSEY